MIYAAVKNYESALFFFEVVINSLHNAFHHETKDWSKCIVHYSVQHNFTSCILECISFIGNICRYHKSLN